jgi:hypothetical protein
VHTPTSLCITVEPRVHQHDKYLMRTRSRPVGQTEYRPERTQYKSATCKAQLRQERARFKATKQEEKKRQRKVMEVNPEEEDEAKSKL